MARGADMTAARDPGLGRPERIKVLMYHRVVCDTKLSRATGRYAVDAAVFESQLQTLERLGYTAITFRDFALYRRGELNLPRKPVIITFDDGYEDTFTTAFPLLREYGMTAVVFIVADPSIRSNAWDDGRDITPANLMSSRQILEMHDAGIEIGSHSLTHPDLTALDRDAAWTEISRSRMLLEMMLNAPVRTFSYPYGLLNDALRAMVVDAGYDFACGVYSGPSVFGGDLLNIRRIEPSQKREPFRFWFQMMTPYQKLGVARHRIRRFLERTEPSLHPPKPGEAGMM